jgi:hypothetical protein
MRYNGIFTPPLTLIDTGPHNGLNKPPMALLHEAVEKKKMDVRMVERNVARGVITQADADAALKSLPDDAENAEYVSIDSLANDEGSGATHH